MIQAKYAPFYSLTCWHFEGNFVALIATLVPKCWAIGFHKLPLS